MKVPLLPLPLSLFFLSFLPFLPLLFQGVPSAFSQDNPEEEKTRLVLLENTNLEPGEIRLHYPLLLDHGKGYRIRCKTQSEEEKVIRGLGFLLMPSVVLDPLSPEVAAAAIENQPTLCPSSTQYPIKLYRHNPGDGEKYYMHFPLRQGERTYGNALYIAGCEGLLLGLALDPRQAIAADPTPFFGDQIFPLHCANGGPVVTKPKNFSEWCLKGDLSPDQKKTVKVLLARTPMGEAALGKREACHDAQTYLEGLSILNLKNLSLSDLSPLSTLKNLTRLLLAGNPLGDQNLRTLSDLGLLTHLDLSSCGLSQANALGNLTKLIDLDLSKNTITDVRPLSSLVSLEKLNLGHNRLGDEELSSLSFLGGLKSLNLEHNQIVDPSLLQSLSQLTQLDLSFNQIREGRLLNGFPSTVALKVQGNPLEIDSFTTLCNLHKNDPTPLGHTIRELILYAGGTDCALSGQKLESSATLTLNEKALVDITPFAYLKNLRILNLSKNQIESVALLSPLTLLRKLNLTQNNIRHMGPLKALVNMEELKIEGNPLEHDSFLSWCFFQNNDLMVPAYQRKTITALLALAGTTHCMKADQKLSTLKTLNLNQKELTGIGVLGEFSHLEFLSLEGNQVGDVSPLKSLQKLKGLNLNLNYLYNMDDLFALGQLEELHLKNNPLHQIPVSTIDSGDFPPLPKLKTLDLENTSITDISPLELFPSLEKGKVNLSGMPLRPVNYLGYCLIQKFAPDDYYLDSVRGTLDLMAQFMKRNNFSYTRCSDAQKWLLERPTLDFKNLGITDPSPLAIVFENKTLDLRNNQIDWFFGLDVLLEKADKNRRRFPGKLHLGLYLKGNPVCQFVQASSLPPDFDLETKMEDRHLIELACHQEPRTE